MNAKLAAPSAVDRLGDKLFMILFAVVWTAGTLFFNYHVFSTIVRQVVAQNFPTSPGRVVESGVETIGKKKVRCRLRIIFAYEVAGTAYRGKRYRYNEDWSSDTEKLAQIAKRFPAGADVEVHYNPHDPADSLLQPGLTGGDLFGALFALPFNVALLALWWIFIPLSFNRGSRQPAGGATMSDDGFVARVRLPQVTPRGIALGIAFALPIVAGIILGFTVGSDPPLQIMLVAWAVILTCVLLAILWQSLRTMSGRWDLVIDRTAGTVRLPLSQGRKQEFVVPLADVTGVSLETLEYRTSKGGRSFNYAPVLCFNTSDGEEQEERIVQWLNKKSAQALVDWLRERLNVPLAAATETENI